MVAISSRWYVMGWCGVWFVDSRAGVPDGVWCGI